MSIKTTPSLKPIHRVSISIASALISAVLEWFLMLLLYIDASFSYLVTRFARHCQLRVPCLLCSRLDHVLGNEGTGFYWDLICNDHKLNISSLILSDLRLTCESCFRSSKLEDASYDADGIVRRCVCCNKQGVLIPNKLTEFKLAEVDASLLTCNRDEVSEIDKGFSRADFLQNEDPHRHVDEYTKIKANSDTDSENQSSDNLIVEPETIESRESTAEQHLTVLGSISEKLRNSEMSLNATDATFSTSKPELLNLTDAYKVAVGAKLRQLSGKILEQQKSMSESTKASEDVKLLLSQISSSAAPRGFELPVSNISPRVSINSEDSKFFDSSALHQLLQRRISLERNESSLSLDSSTVSEIEGKNPVDRLKRQVEHDKKVMNSLYRELEEERNASAVAANQAMAMITRLQEEKAALHTEALQYLRMMEEQAEYDCDALQKANELLLEREKQARDFESELEIYRKCGTASSLDYDGVGRSRLCLQEFGDAKEFVIQHLKKLELKLSRISKDECLSEKTTDEKSRKNLDYVTSLQERGGTQILVHDEEGLRMFGCELSAVIKRLEAFDVL